MLRGRTPACLGTHFVTHRDPRALPVPCAQRWDLRLGRAKLWQETIDPSDRGPWQLEDERHMSPEFGSFIGFPMREMAPSRVGYNSPAQLLQRRLPNQTFIELASRRDIPYQQNAMFGKLLYDKTFHGAAQPYGYLTQKQMHKAARNDRKLAQNKFRVLISSGVKKPPANFNPIPDPVREEVEDPKKRQTAAQLARKK